MSDISPALIRKYLQRADVREALNAQYGESNWDVEELTAYIAQQTGDAPEDASPPSAAPRSPQPEDDIPTFDEILAEYLAIYEEPLPQDRALFHNLVHLEVQMALLRQEMKTPAGRDQKKYLTQLKDQITAHREMQKTLGIDRATRAKESAGEMDRVLKYMDRADELLESRAVHIICPHCLEEKAEVKINQGFIVFHFSENVSWRWESTCPRCGKDIVLEGGVKTASVDDQAQN